MGGLRLGQYVQYDISLDFSKVNILNYSSCIFGVLCHETLDPLQSGVSAGGGSTCMWLTRVDPVLCPNQEKETKPGQTKLGSYRATCVESHIFVAFFSADRGEGTWQLKHVVC